MKNYIYLLLVVLLAGCNTILHREAIRSVPRITLGKTPISTVIDANTIGYYDASEMVLYVDEKNRDRVLHAMNARPVASNFRISRGDHFVAQGNYFDIKRIHPFADLPLNAALGLNDAKTVADFVCTLAKAGECYNKLESAEPVADVAFSFDVPSYGMSGCEEAVGETCVSWFAKETVTKYRLEDCQGTKTTEEVECLVCSMP